MSSVTLRDLPSKASCEQDRELLESFLFRCQIKNLTEASSKDHGERLYYLMRFAIELGKPLHSLSEKNLQDYIMSIPEKVSPATVNGRISVFKVFYNYLSKEGLVETNPSDKLKKVKEPKRIKPVLSLEEIGAVLSTLDRKAFHGKRDYCMTLLTYDAMLRPNELLSIKLEECRPFGETGEGPGQAEQAKVLAILGQDGQGNPYLPDPISQRHT